MPIIGLNPPKFKPPKEAVVTYDTWREGWNSLLRENEIKGSEMAKADNLLLIGSGIPTKRWGSQNYFVSAPSTGHRGNFVKRFKDSAENQQILALSDYGVLVKKSGTSYTEILGASWPSGSYIDAEQLGGKVYFVSDKREFVRYDFSTLTSFPTLATPQSLTATAISTVTGSLTSWSWRVTAVSKSGGETTGSENVSLASLPQNLAQTLVRLSWQAVSAASGDLQGYNVYRGSAGDEVWVGGTQGQSTTFDDYGSISGDLFRSTPLANTTGGIKAKYIIRFQDRIILAGIPGDPTKIAISGRWPFQERFDWYVGGGELLIEPDSGESITGLGIHQEKLVVFKENSVWQVTLDQTQFGVYLILTPQYKLLTASQGCTSHKSIVPVENDLMFANRQGIYILRYEPQLLTVLNANEISAKIRPFFQAMTNNDHENAAAGYIDKKYVISFPNAKKTVMFDRERLAFMGPWTTPFGIARWDKFVDSTGTERWVAIDSDDAYITEFSRNLKGDKGNAINTVFKSKREDFDDWTLFKTLNEAYLHFRAVEGQVSVNLYLEDRAGKVVVAKSFTVTGAVGAGTSGFGIDGFGDFLFGDTEETPSAAEDETIHKAFVYKSARTFQLEVRTTGATSNYELLGSKVVAVPQARGNSPSSWNV